MGFRWTCSWWIWVRCWPWSGSSGTSGSRRRRRGMGGRRRTRTSWSQVSRSPGTRNRGDPEPGHAKPGQSGAGSTRSRDNPEPGHAESRQPEVGQRGARARPIAWGAVRECRTWFAGNVSVGWIPPAFQAFCCRRNVAATPTATLVSREVDLQGFPVLEAVFSPPKTSWPLMDLMAGSLMATSMDQP